jgi:1-acyl-sn-glycerol-3-phosphate acyltransferase
MAEVGTPAPRGASADPLGHYTAAGPRVDAPARASQSRGIAIDPADLAFRGFFGAAKLLQRYHRHRVLHIERLERLLGGGRRVILVGNHAFDIVDPLLLLARVYERTGRVPHFIGHENGWFKVPVLRDIAARFQVIPSRRPEETARALRRDGFLMLYPGSNREAAMRSYRDEPYRLKWEGRTGFLRLALEADADIVFVAALGSDELYYQSVLPTPRALLRLANAGDDERYRGARLTFGLLGAHLIPGMMPLPVRITHFLSPPLDLGDRAAVARDSRAFEALHARIWQQSQAFLDAAVRRRSRYTDPLDRALRSAQRRLQGFGV